MINGWFEDGINTSYGYVSKNGSVVAFSENTPDIYEGTKALAIDITTVGTGGP